MTQTPAGWYPDPEMVNTQRYWDGAAWTEHRAPATPIGPAPAPMRQQPAMHAGPLLQFTSHIAGRNAQVFVYANRIEWARQGGMTVGKAALGAATFGASFATKAGRGGGKGTGTEMIPMKSISSITTRRDSITNSVVAIISSGNVIEMRVSHAEAERVKQTVMSLIL